jgi:PAS domain S-box-containing protein
MMPLSAPTPAAVSSNGTSAPKPSSAGPARARSGGCWPTRSCRNGIGIATGKASPDPYRRGTPVLNQRLELMAMRRDGSEFPVELTIWSTGNASQRMFNAFIRDITEQKRSAAVAAQARDEAERANRAKSDFLSRMSHELRTPSNAVLGFGQLLINEPLTEEALDSVHQILRGGKHLLDLINEVLDISRIEAGRLSLSLEPVGVRDIVHHVVDLVAALTAQRSIRLVVDELDPAHAGVADRQRLGQILLNLISNAVKYNRPNGSVTVGFEAVSASRLRIKMTDTGAGIRPEKMQLLFNPFERLGAETTTIEGTGLGLALSRGPGGGDGRVARREQRSGPRFDVLDRPEHIYRGGDRSTGRRERGAVRSLRHAARDDPVHRRQRVKRSSDDTVVGCGLGSRRRRRRHGPDRPSARGTRRRSGGLRPHVDARGRHPAASGRARTSRALGRARRMIGTLVLAFVFTKRLDAAFQDRLAATFERDRLFDLSIDPIVIVGFDGACRQRNGAWHALRGFAKPGDERFLDSIHVDDQQTVETAFNALRAGAPHVSFETRCLQAVDGVERTVAWGSAAVTSARAIYLVGEDVTDERRMIAELRANEERFQLAARASNDAMREWTISTGVVWWNDAFFTLFDHDRDRIEGIEDGWFARIHPDDCDAVRARLDEFLASNRIVWTDEYRLRRRDDSYLWVFDRGYLVRDAQRRPVRMIAAMMDITTRKEAERMKSDFVSFVSLQLQPRWPA